MSILFQALAGPGPIRLSHLVPPPSEMTTPRPPRTSIAVVLTALLLTGCGEQAATAPTMPGGAMPTPEVSVVALHPQSVAITSELPGRTTASLTAEVRPQVDGIIKERLFEEGSEVKAGDIALPDRPGKLSGGLRQRRRPRCRRPRPPCRAPRPRSSATRAWSSRTPSASRISTTPSRRWPQAKADVAAAKASARDGADQSRLHQDHGADRRPDRQVVAHAGRAGDGEPDRRARPPSAQIDPIYVDVTQSSTNLLKLRRALAEGTLQVRRRRRRR